MSLVGWTFSNRAAQGTGLLGHRFKLNSTLVLIKITEPFSKAESTWKRLFFVRWKIGFLFSVKILNFLLSLVKAKKPINSRNPRNPKLTIKPHELTPPHVHAHFAHAAWGLYWHFWVVQLGMDGADVEAGVAGQKMELQRPSVGQCPVPTRIATSKGNSPKNLA